MPHRFQDVVFVRDENDIIRGVTARCVSCRVRRDVPTHILAADAVWVQCPVCSAATVLFVPAMLEWAFETQLAMPKTGSA